MVPLDPKHPGYFQVPEDYFQSTLPSQYSSFIYDTVMSIGLGACDALLALEKQDPQKDPKPGPPPPPSQGGVVKGPSPAAPPSQDLPSTLGSSPLPPPPPKKKKSTSPLHAAILNASFTGALGKVKFHKDHRTRVRDAAHVHVGVYNVRSVDDDETTTTTGMRSYQQVLTAVWEPDVHKWRNIDGESFLYSNNSTVAPISFQILDQHHLYLWVRVVGLVLFSVAWLLALAGAVAVWYLSEDEAVRLSQPVFQIMICVGSAISSTSIFTLSQDEGSGWGQDMLDTACTVTPWFFFMGQVVVFCAMFTKLWRLDKILQFARRSVKFKDVSAPLLLLCLLTFGVLLKWTIVDPWTWNRQVISTIPPETYGECQSDMFWAFFGPLMAIILIAEVITVFFAFKTSDVSVHLSDSVYILMAICTQIQAWIVGVPILAVLGDSSSSATYFGRIFLIWIFAVSSVVTVVWPRIFLAIKLRRNPELASSKSRVHISGLVDTPPPPHPVMLITAANGGGNSVSGLQSSQGNLQSDAVSISAGTHYSGGRSLAPSSH